MKADAYSVFVNMFLALDATWEDCEEKDDALRGYLSEASPYTFAGKGSADLAIWAECSRAFEMQFPNGEASLEDAHGFAVCYLENMSDEYTKIFGGKRRLVDVFLESAPLDRWLEAFELQEG